MSDQHYKIRELFKDGITRPWSDWNEEAVAEWLMVAGGE